jgi:hypothetical protein
MTLEIDSEVAISEAAAPREKPAHTEKVYLLQEVIPQEMSALLEDVALSEAAIPFKGMLLPEALPEVEVISEAADDNGRKHSHRPLVTFSAWRMICQALRLRQPLQLREIWLVSTVHLVLSLKSRATRQCGVLTNQRRNKTRIPRLQLLKNRPTQT